LLAVIWNYITLHGHMNIKSDCTMRRKCSFGNLTMN